MKKLTSLWLAFVVVFALAACGDDKGGSDDTSAATTAAGGHYEGRKVVWLDSYFPGYAGADARGEGIQSVFAGTGIDLLELHFDSNNILEEDARQAKAEELRAAIDAFGPDVIIATDDNVQEYVIVPFYKDTDIPVIFSGVNQDATPYGYPASNITGMIEVDLIEQLVAQLGQYTDHIQVGFLGDDTTSTHRSAEFYGEKFENMTAIFTNSYEEFKQDFLDLQAEATVIIVYNNAGISDWDEADAAQFFTENTHVPTGAVLDWMSPYVLQVTGRVATEHGEWPAQMALEVLDGRPISDIPVTPNEQYNLIVNLDIAGQLDIVFSPDILRYATIVGGEATTPE